MKGLKCTTHNCTHNRNCHCHAGIINVGKTGVCMTKQKREYGILEQNAVNLEAARDFDFSDSDDLLIQCDSTKCKFNRDRICTSNAVHVGDSVLRTKCYTKNVQA